jgi:hypothetical protein
VSANLDVIRAEWRARALASHRSAALATEFLAWLLRLRFSPDLLQQGHGVIGVCLDRADLCWEVHEALGGTDDPLDAPEGAFVIPHAPGAPTADRVIVAGFALACVGWTVAEPLWMAMAERTTEAAPKAAVERIARTMPELSGFGWAVLDECLERDRHAAVAALEASMPATFGDAQRSWGRVPDDWIEPVGPKEQRYGLIPRARYKREFFQAIAERVLPRLDERNIDGRVAWGKRTG